MADNEQIQLPLSEQLIHATVRIECHLEDGSVATGTGFFYRFLQGTKKSIPAVVTNKHVVQGAKTGYMHLTLRDGDLMPEYGRHIRVRIEDFAEKCIFHPDVEVDLCIFLVGPAMNEIEKEFGQAVFFVGLVRENVADSSALSELTPLEEVIMIGYPNGIWDKKNNTPIIRRGITATPPALDLEGRGEFMIDAACYPGSSGSPVFLFNQGAYASKLGGLVMGSRVMLLGVLYAGPQVSIEGEITIQDVPTQSRLVPISRFPINLGLCIKAYKVFDFEEILLKSGVEAPAGYEPIS